MKYKQCCLAVDSAAQDSPAQLPERLTRLLPLAELSRKKRRVAPEALKGIIENICRDEWLQASELAILMNRDPEKLQSRFLTAMVREGRLQLRFPGVPNRPDQAYRTLSQGISS